MEIIKRDGRKVTYDKEKVISATLKAFKEVDGEITPEAKKKCVEISDYIESLKTTLTVEQIQNIVEDKLMASKRKDVARKYITYRNERNFIRNGKFYKWYKDEIVNKKSEENSNANVDENNFGGKEMRISDDILEHNVDILIREKLGEKIYEDTQKSIKIHDKSKFTLGTHNCLLMPYKDMITKNGIETRQGDTKPTKTYNTACHLIPVAIQSQSLDQFGGCGLMNFSIYMVQVLKNTIAKFTSDIIDDLDLDIEKPQCGISFKESKALLGDRVYKKVKRKVDKDVENSDQALITNLVTLQSRSGHQLPFSSINLGLIDPDNEEESSYIVEMFLKEVDKGIGKMDRTAVFPISIFQIKGGVNRYPQDKFYYLRMLAQEVSHRRLYPTFVNCDFSHNIITSWESEMNQMGCVEGNEIITYKYKDKLYVESFKRMWDRLSDYFSIKEQNKGDNKNLYLDVDGVEIYDTEKGFVNTKRVIRNTSTNWVNVKMSHGRSLVCTTDHPFHTERGRIFAKDLKTDDIVNINPNQYFEESLVFNDNKAWLLGFILCDGCYDSHVTSSIAFDSEDDIQNAYILRMKSCFDCDVNVVEQHRGTKGNYKDLCSTGNVTDIIDYLSTKFEGLTKVRRHIPNEVFSWNYTAKLSFLAGMIDADGYINPNTHNGSIVQLGSTNKELALQQMALAQSLNMPCAIYQNHYSKTNPNAIRYRVEFAPSDDLLTFIVSQKKLDNYIENGTDYKHYKSKINSVEPIEGKCDYSYDVTTDSDHFEVSGIYSHNCRTMLGYDRFTGTYNREGRGNLFPTTINLPYLALEQKGDINKFFNRLNEVLEEVHQINLLRYNIICSQHPSVAPFIRDNKTMIDADKCTDNLEPQMKHGTIAYGYIGVAEACKALTGYYHNQSKEAQNIGLKMIETIKKFADKCSEEDNLNYSVYATPAEGYCYKGLEIIKRDFGEIEGISDKDYLTNSHHCPVSENIDVFTKVDIESPYAAYALGGNIFHIEVDGVNYNRKAITRAIDYALEKDIPYIRISHPIATCLDCGFKIGKYMEKCEKCNSDNVENLAIVTGYLSTDISHMNKGKQSEVHDRKLNIQKEVY